MEFASGRSGHGGKVKEGQRSESSGGDDEGHRKEEIDIEVPPMVDSTGPTASSTKNEVTGELESAKAEMGAVRQENERLKQCLDSVLKDYRTLQMQFQGIIHKDTKESNSDKGQDYNKQETVYEESDLVSLSLGRVPTSINIPRNKQNSKVLKPLLLKGDKEELALGLEYCKFQTSKSGSINNEASVPNVVPTSPSNNSCEVAKEGEAWLPSKVLKTERDHAGEDEVSQQNPAKKARVCVRVRCDTPTLNDGCQWRKYGQKIAKGNPCPRAYYRCTVASSCPVRKQVQRCAEDMSILMTTYEGIHNHPLSLSATAMASTTSAAASMLLSGSSTSRSASLPSSTSTATATTSVDLHGLNYYLSSDGSKSKQFYPSNPSSLSSSSTSHQTITLDLTTNPVSRFSNYTTPRSSYPYPSSTTLSFSTSHTNNDHFLTYNNRNVFSSMNVLRRPTVENIYHHLPSSLQKNSVVNNPNIPLPPSHALPDTIAMATKAIAADPKFQSALAVALGSIIGAGSGIGSTQGSNHGGGGDSLAQKLKWGELFPASSPL